MPGKEFINVGLPKELIKEIDKVMKEANLGYRSRAEFVKESVRKRVEELRKKK